MPNNAAIAIPPRYASDAQASTAIALISGGTVPQGAMYLNTGTNSLRCFAGDNWSPAGVCSLKGNVSLADINALGASLTGQVVVGSLPANALPVAARIFSANAVAGVALASFTILAQLETGPIPLTTALDLFAAGAGVAKMDSELPISLAAVPAAQDVELDIVSVGTLLNAITGLAAGIDVEVSYIQF